MTVIKVSFRKTVRAPSVVLADMGRGVSIGVASPLISAPCDSEHACSFHASHGVAERFLGDVFPQPPNRDLDIAPFSKPVCFTLIGLACFAIWSAGALAWWWA